MMAASDDMRERLERVETKVDRLDTKVDRLDTKVDRLDTKVGQLDTKVDAIEKRLDGIETKADQFATKADLVQFKEEILDRFAVVTEDLRDSVRKAAEGFGATLDRIERTLVDMNTRFGDRLSDHDKVLANHNQRITTIETSHAR